MTTTQSIITIVAVVLGTMVTRFLPFLIFPEGKTPPAYIQYLGKVLPYAVIGLLVIYCLKDVPASSTYGLLLRKHDDILHRLVFLQIFGPAF